MVFAIEAFVATPSLLRVGALWELNRHPLATATLLRGPIDSSLRSSAHLIEIEIRIRLTRIFDIDSRSHD